MTQNNFRFIFAGGGTGGHLYPIVAVAEEVKNLYPQASILFVGTKGKIESRVIPKLGYKFKSILISGFSRKLTLKNILFPLKLVVALLQSAMIVSKFKPHVTIGAGAYVAGPISWVSSIFGSRLVLLEQNSFPGVTNRFLQNRADSIHLSFKDSKQYFNSKANIKLTGNPVRTNLKLADRIKAVESFGLNPRKYILLIIGGSLGARSINEAVANSIEELINKGIQIIWQTGELYYSDYKNFENDSVKIFSFLSDMALAYSACDLLLARAGATTIAEVAYLGLPVIFVPSTNVAANHQYLNAKSLLDNNAALLIEDKNLNKELVGCITKTVEDKNLINQLKLNIKKFSKPDSAKVIAEDVINLAKKYS